MRPVLIQFEHPLHGYLDIFAKSLNEALQKAQRMTGIPAKRIAQEWVIYETWLGKLYFQGQSREEVLQRNPQLRKVWEDWDRKRAERKAALERRNQ